MAYTDPNARKEVRYRVNMNHYQADAIEALARQHLEAYREPLTVPDVGEKRSGRDRREDRVARTA